MAKGEEDMNFLKRACLSVKARKGKTLLQIFIFTAICVLVLSGLSIQTAAKKSGDLARQKLGADVTLQVDMEKMRENMQSQRQEGERPRFTSTPLPAEQGEELTTYDQIKGYNFFSSTTGLASDFDPIESENTETSTTVGNMGMGPGGNMPDMGQQGDISIQGLVFSDAATEFMEGSATLIEGEHITDKDIGQNVVIIEETLAEENDLSVGDTITVTNPRDESLTIELSIKGIYQTSSTSSGQGMGIDFTAMIPYNKLYVPYTATADLKGHDYEGTIDSAIYYIDDPADMESFIAKAKEESSIDFDIFTLEADDRLYQQMVGPIENVASFSNNIVYLVSIAGAIILGLIVMMSIRERKFEMGVLLALGEKRWKLIGQFIAELLIVAVISLGVASISGNLVAEKVSDQLLSQEMEASEQATTPESFRGGPQGGFGGGAPAMPGQGGPQQTADVELIDELDVSVTAKDLGILAGIGLLIAMVSALLPSLSVLRLHPKTILTKQD